MKSERLRWVFIAAVCAVLASAVPLAGLKEAAPPHNGTDQGTVDELRPPVTFGHCTLNSSGNLTGYCTASLGTYGCVTTHNTSACPPGAKAKIRGQSQCCSHLGCGPPFAVDLGRPCVAP